MRARQLGSRVAQGSLQAIASCEASQFATDDSCDSNYRVAGRCLDSEGGSDYLAGAFVAFGFGIGTVGTMMCA